jgi:hypothetical protein
MTKADEFMQCIVGRMAYADLLIGLTTPAAIEARLAIDEAVAAWERETGRPITDADIDAGIDTAFGP